jgi:hypothetical protein
MHRIGAKQEYEWMERLCRQGAAMSSSKVAHYILSILPILCIL